MTQGYNNISKFLKVREKSYPFVMGKHPPEKNKMRHPADPVKTGDTVYVKKAPDVLVEVIIEEISPEEIHCGRVINVLGSESEEIFIGAAVCFPKDYIDTISCSD